MTEFSEEGKRTVVKEPKGNTLLDWTESQVYQTRPVGSGDLTPTPPPYTESKPFSL